MLLTFGDGRHQIVEWRRALAPGVDADAEALAGLVRCSSSDSDRP
ncbi:MAG: hypothetical protein WCJ64_21690 [Rhodospirillaceae bacterium]